MPLVSIDPRHVYILLAASQRSTSVTSPHATTSSRISLKLSLSSPWAFLAFDKINLAFSLLRFVCFMDGKIFLNKII